MLRRRDFIACGLSGLVPSWGGAVRAESDLESEDYPLDEVSRRVPPRGPLKCPDVEIEVYRGEHIRYAAAAKVYTGFRARLELMEQVVAGVGVASFGRAPRRLVHLGTYNCRRMRKHPSWISEHALGNAIDVAGFDFGALPKGAELPEGVPRVFRHAFSARVARHWKKKRGPAAHLRRFLHDAARALVARKDIFRVLLGPAFPGHYNHFHFDCAPFRLVEIFDDESSS